MSELVNVPIKVPIGTSGKTIDIKLHNRLYCHFCMSNGHRDTVCPFKAAVEELMSHSKVKTGKGKRRAYK